MNLRVERISYDECKHFILDIHYARRMPCIQYAFGLFDGSYPYPVGCVTYGQPASPPLCKGLAGEENRKHVLELNRLVLYPEYNGQNCASYLVSHSLRRLPGGTFVVSYADWGGGGMSGTFIRQPIGFIQASQNQEPINTQNRVMPDTTPRMRHEGNLEQQNTAMYILLGARSKRNRCFPS